MREQIKNNGIRSQPYLLFCDLPVLCFFTFKQVERGFLPLVDLVPAPVSSSWSAFIKSKSSFISVTGLTALLDLYLLTYDTSFFDHFLTHFFDHRLDLEAALPHPTWKLGLECP